MYVDTDMDIQYIKKYLLKSVVGIDKKYWNKNWW